MSEVASNEPDDTFTATVTRPTTTPFQPSPQQLAVFNWVDSNPGSLAVIAKAGCGKSTLLVELVKRLKGRVFLGAFNKSIATELQQRIGFLPNVEASTMHALGYKLCRGVFSNRKVELDSKKVRGLAKGLVPWDRKYTDVLTDLVGYGKQAGFGVVGCPGVGDKEAWEGLCDHFDVWDEISSLNSKRIIKDAIVVYQQSMDLCKTEARIDFDDMILAPLLFGQPVPIYDWFLGDEWQDASLMRRLLVKFVLKPQGRVCLVADPAQSIYAFAGASVDSVDASKLLFNCSELPLSVTYRCPKAVVLRAQEWVPDIQAHESAPEGKITLLNHRELWNQEFSASDVILCRNTRPLIGIAQRLRRLGVPCVVEGNSGRTIVALATKWGEITVGQLKANLTDYLEEQKAKWMAKDRLDKVETVEERVGEIRDLAYGMPDGEYVRKLVSKIESLFGQGEDDRDVLRLCTIHRYKGRESNRVFWIGPEMYQPSKWAKKDWEMAQELNLMYVAVTRAKRELVEVEVAPPVRGMDGEMVEWWQW